MVCPHMLCTYSLHPPLMTGSTSPTFPVVSWVSVCVCVRVCFASVLHSGRVFGSPVPILKLHEAKMRKSKPWLALLGSGTSLARADAQGKLYACTDVQFDLRCEG